MDILRLRRRKNLPKQIWGRKDRGLASDVRALIKFFWMTVFYLQRCYSIKASVCWKALIDR